MAFHGRVIRLSPSISNFQECSCRSRTSLIADLIDQVTRYDTYVSLPLTLDTEAPESAGHNHSFQTIVRVNPPVPRDIGQVDDENLSAVAALFCDIRVRILPCSGDSRDEAQDCLQIHENDILIGQHVEDLQAPKKSYKHSVDTELPVQVLKSSTIKAMKVTVIVQQLCDIPDTRSIAWITLQKKLCDILSTYDLHINSNTLIDLRECPLAGTSSLAFLFVEECTLKNTAEENVIGRVGVNTKIEIVGAHDVGYYKRQLMAFTATLNQNIFDGASSNIYAHLQDLIKLQVKMKDELGNQEISIWRGILLAGPTGCGKNTLVQELCRRLAINLIQFNLAVELLTSTSILEHGSACEKLESVFEKAIRSSKKYPTVLLIQQLHVLDTGGSTTSRSANTKMKLIVHMCKLFDNISRVSAKTPLTLTVIGTTGQPHLVGTQLRMFGRLEEEIFMSLPTESERLEILKFLTSSMNEFMRIDLRLAARATPGYTRAELAKLMHSVRIKNTSRSRSLQQEGSTFIEMGDIEQSIKNIHPTAMKGFLVDAPNVKWEDIGGQKDLKFKLKQCVEWPLKHEEAFKRLGISPPRGVLMYGPPGCSKTMIAKALASECGVNFFSVNGSELFSQFVGDSEKAVRSLFREARQVSPCIVFFDEIDSIIGERGSSSKGASSVHERVIAQLLTEIDGVEALKCVTIVAATNRPDMIDPALLRPGRLDRIVYVPLPDDETRRDIFNIHFRKMPVSQNVDVDKLVQLTKGYSGAEVAAVCHEAALKSLEDNVDAEKVEQTHFIEALKSITAGTTQSQIEMYESYNKSRPI